MGTRQRKRVVSRSLTQAAIKVMGMLPLVLMAPAHAGQTDADVVKLLRECQAVSSNAARLGCYDALSRELSTHGILTQSDYPEGSQEPIQSETRSGPGSEEPLLASGVGFVEKTGTVAKHAPLNGSAPSASTGRSGKAFVTASEAMGEKYLPKRESGETQKRASLSLIDIYKDRNSRWVFKLEDGQVWQQTEARYLQKPKELPVVVTISEGVFGSYDLRAEFLSKKVKVKRLQ